MYWQYKYRHFLLLCTRLLNFIGYNISGTSRSCHYCRNDKNYTYQIYSFQTISILLKLLFRTTLFFMLTKALIFLICAITLLEELQIFTDDRDFINLYSTSKCNKRRSDFYWRSKPQTYSGTIIYQKFYLSDMLILILTERIKGVRSLPDSSHLSYLSCPILFRLFPLIKSRSYRKLFRSCHVDINFGDRNNLTRQYKM